MNLERPNRVGLTTAKIYPLRVSNVIHGGCQRRHLASQAEAM